VTHCGKIHKQDWLILPHHDTLESIYRRYKWYYLWPKIYMQLITRQWEEKTVVIENMCIDEELFGQYSTEFLTIDTVVLNPAVQLLQVRPQWAKTMDWSDFVRWYL
jgi:hypothetical protein